MNKMQSFWAVILLANLLQIYFGEPSGWTIAAFIGAFICFVFEGD